jgi:hypothetical protein
LPNAFQSRALVLNNTSKNRFPPLHSRNGGECPIRFVPYLHMLLWPLRPFCPGTLEHNVEILILTVSSQHGGRSPEA